MSIAHAVTVVHMAELVGEHAGDLVRGCVRIAAARRAEDLAARQRDRVRIGLARTSASNGRSIPLATLSFSIIG